MKTRRAVYSVTAAVVMLTWAFPAHAIRVCYDYVYYRLTGTDPNPPSSKPGYKGEKDITAYLQGISYYQLPKPPTGDQFKKGDIIIVNGHIGFVNGPNDIDHYIQIFGELTNQNVAYAPGGLKPFDKTKIPQGSPKAIGGLYRNNSLEAFLEAPFHRPASYQIWRKCETILLMGVCSGR